MHPPKNELFRLCHHGEGIPNPPEISCQSIFSQQLSVANLFICYLYECSDVLRQRGNIRDRQREESLLEEIDILGKHS